MRPNPHQFAAFAHVIREGGFSRAAERLGVTQSAVTQHVAKLERAVGSALLHRGPQGVTLTKAGQEFYDLADRLVTLDTLIAEKIAGYSSLEQGRLTVIANAPRPALGLLARFRKAHPDVEVDFTLFDWTEAMRLLRQRLVDVAIVTEPDRIGSCFSRQVGAARYVAYVQAGDKLAARGRISLRDLAAGTVLVPEEGSFTARILARKLAEHDIVFPRRIRTTTFPVMKEAILHGVGSGVFLEDSAFASDGLRTLPLTEMPETYRTMIVSPSDKCDLKVVRSFIDLAV